MKFQLSALFLSISAIVAVNTLAEQPGDAGTSSQSAAPAFTEVDRDGSGSISIGEAEGTWLAEIFAIADLNSDGMIDQAEYTEALS
ncbi:hypothetical protein [Congregibacter sp.]|uniref:hypothetical protein n=1 Tax=Congregibacter sp. TaxID=2744308 RepID=UPI00385FF457